jgi:hypothetical protein
MQQSYRLKQGDILLGTLKPYGLDFPWLNCKFQPTNNYASVKHLFDSELQELNNETNSEKWEEQYQKIIGLNLCLESEDGSEKIHEFLLHIEGDEAWFRY